jgi:hypothetical protein
MSAAVSHAEEAQRLQALEVALLGASSTGWQPAGGPATAATPSALSAPAAPFAWAWRDAPLPAQPQMVPAPAPGPLSFGCLPAPAAGFVFGARPPCDANGSGLGGGGMDFGAEAHMES